LYIKELSLNYILSPYKSTGIKRGRNLRYGHHAQVVGGDMLPNGKYLRMNYISLILNIMHVMEILGWSRYFPMVVKE